MIRFLHGLIQQRLLVILCVIMICIAGFFTVTQINREYVPNVSFDMVSITTVYPGGSPDDTEQLITIPIEKKLREVDGLDKVRSYNIENVSVVVAYIDDRVGDTKKVVDDIKDAVEQVENLPGKAQKPLVKEITFDSTPVIDIAITGKNTDVPYAALRLYADEFEDFIYDMDGVAKVEKFGFYDREYLVEVDPNSLNRYRLGMNSVINTLSARNIDLPGGPLRIGKSEFILRTKGQFKNADEIRDTVIMANDAGFTTRIRDVARVTDTFKEPDVHQRINSQESIVFRVWKKQSADEIHLVTAMKKQITANTLPGVENIKITLFNDYSRMTQDRLKGVIKDALTGFILLVMILFIFLGMRMAGLVSLSIPISFMIAFMAMKASHITLNIISMFGLIMVLGMIVDFSIVVSENSHRYIEQGLKKRLAIEKGIAEIFWPVTMTLFCLATAFAPLLFLTGIMGKFIRGIPVVVITCLVASWFMAMFILPTFLDMFAPEHNALAHGKQGRFNLLLNKIVEKIKSIIPFKKITSTTSNAPRSEDPNYEEGWFGQLQRNYKKFLASALDHRYRTLGILVVLFITSLFLAKIVGFQFLAVGGEEQIEIKIKLPQETNLAANLSEMKKIESIIMKLPSEEIEAVHAHVGEETADIIDPKPGEGTHKSTFNLFLTPDKTRKRNAYQINEWLRSQVTAAQNSGIVTKEMDIRFQVQQNGPPIGKPVNVEIRGKDFTIMKQISREYMTYLSTVDGVRDISMDLEEGKQEYRYGINEELAAQTGVSVYDIAMALNASFEGMISTRINRDEEEIGIRVRFPEDARKKMTSLHNVVVSNHQGGLMPLDSVSSVSIEPGYSQINRLNFKRLVQVQAEVDTNKITSNEVNSLLQKKFRDIEKKYPGYLIAYGGENEDSGKSMSELAILFIFALCVIYIALAVFMNSMILPLVVMIAIPFALLGVIFALFIHGQSFSFMSTLGLFSLAGIIVSNTLVLVQFINNLRDKGMPLRDALIEGGVIRLRPIILTAGAAVLGLIPSIYGLGGKDYFVSPLAMSFGYGLIFATFITLVLIPCFYHIAEDIKSKISLLLEARSIHVSPAIYTPRGSGQKPE